MNDELVSVMGQHEVETGALELAVEDQVRFGNHERAIRHVTVRLRDEGLGGKGIDMDIGGRVGTLAVQEDRGVKFASVIQPGTVKRVKI
ncbi:hypothetical protein BDS110ZK25_45350 [Bradyrhizobium diazoefficiens]|uniref:Uncharacterized protein n=1 Tax=Bradyrhizobium diazoefficiens TaxID=1355477 RepID=A0A810A8N0_9BRAD|nr:hypothetical protein F07S3_86190 [Bradyrhizobium diazoefficiens]BCA07831.1 hypothetical protein H12S4_87350 [Bradyrhizobium diazoefficiens]BCA16475.1 hypothetical protein BDHF08_83220 [Bradyrhizobium diazoefficiens]BCA25184.1 hypothetical protein BDHH15_83990 [Bradyrhizobium diazoefficiens]BCE25898.1 hypothetical protein XF1B_85790 [Bradyrhizobium diazoefficiens]